MSMTPASQYFYWIVELFCFRKNNIFIIKLKTSFLPWKICNLPPYTRKYGLMHFWCTAPYDLLMCCQYLSWNRFLGSVGPPGSGSVCQSYSSESGSFHHQAKIVRKPLIFCWHLESHWRKGQDTDPDPLVRGRIRESGSGSIPICHRSGTLLLSVLYTAKPNSICH